MKLFFEDAHEQLRLIAELDSGVQKTELANAIDNAIRRFCTERNFKVPYMRIWNAMRDGKEVTVFDVGSHSEFFITIPQSMDCFLTLSNTKEDEFKNWVASILSNVEETQPFCPFSGYGGIGYCDAAYTDRCYTCEEAIGAFRKKEMTEESV